MERGRRLNQFVSGVVARAGAEGFKLEEIVEMLIDLNAEQTGPKPGARESE